MLRTRLLQPYLHNLLGRGQSTGPRLSLVTTATTHYTADGTALRVEFGTATNVDVGGNYTLTVKDRLGNTVATKDDVTGIYAAGDNSIEFQFDSAVIAAGDTQHTFSFTNFLHGASLPISGQSNYSITNTLVAYDGWDANYNVFSDAAGLVPCVNGNLVKIWKNKAGTQQVDDLANRGYSGTFNTNSGSFKSVDYSSNWYITGTVSLPNNDYAVAIRCAISSTGQFSYAISYGTPPAGSGTYGTRLASYLNTDFYYFDTNTNSTASGGGGDTSWHTHSATYDGTNHKYYIDGVLRQTIANANPRSNDNVQVGANGCVHKVAGFQICAPASINVTYLTALAS